MAFRVDSLLGKQRRVLPPIVGLGRLWTVSIARKAAAHQQRSEWAQARKRWIDAIRRAKPFARQAPDMLARFQLQVAMCDFFLGHQAEALRNLQIAETSSARVRASAEALLLRARLTRSTEPEQARALLLRALEIEPDNTPILYEICSLALDRPDPAQALPFAARLVRLDGNNVSFRLVSADLAERSGRWDLARREIEAMVSIDPAAPGAHLRLIDTLEASGHVEEARAVAVRFRKSNPEELIVWHRLLDVYIRAGETVRARLLCRFLVRKWPHSRWHRLKYAELLAIAGRLNAADGELARFDGQLSEVDFARTLWSVAKLAGARHEALARLERIRSEVPQNLDLDLDYGYALADVEGAAAARAHFFALSIRSRFERRTLHGLAHMAVRERSAADTLKAWRRAAEVHPDDAYAIAEYCRALFENGQGDSAIALCSAHFRRFEQHRAFVEFYVWLNTAVGRFEATLAFCLESLPKYAQSWQLLECGMICAVYLGRVDEFCATALKVPFQVAYEKDLQRLYTVMRIASIARREAVLANKFRVTYRDKLSHPWLMRFKAPSPTDVDQGRTPVLQSGTRLSDSLYAGSRFEGLAAAEPIAAFRAKSREDIDRILDGSPQTRRTIHIFGRFEQPRGGSELHALDLAERLRPYATVELWSPTMCHSSFLRDGQVRVIDAGSGELPSRNGVVVLVGLYFDLQPWIAEIAPSRIVALYNTFEAPLAMMRLDAITRWTGLRTELLYCSEMIGRELGLPGLFEPSPTDLTLFSPRPAVSGPFTIGRHSRDVVEKHHPEDAGVYRAVAARGGRSILLGGLSMRESFGPIDGLELRPATSKGIPEFLNALSCFFYRTGTWVEPWGRVVIEAMACGLPVVAHRAGGYAEAIEDGTSGFLFDETDEAIEQIDRLMTDPDFRMWMGRQARTAAERIVGPDAMRRLAAFYLVEPGVKNSSAHKPRSDASRDIKQAPLQDADGQDSGGRRIQS